jgi:hypothetical protein
MQNAQGTKGYWFGGLDEVVVKPPNISEVIPDSGLFRTYVARAQRLTDAPSVYHVGALLGTLSAVLVPHTRLLFKSGDRAHHEPLQLWVLLCGKSKNRKSHSLDLATAALGPWTDRRLCPDSGTREGFEEFMIRHPDAFLAIREGPTWLSDNRAVWMRNGSAWWCKIFDGKLEPKLRRRDKESKELERENLELRSTLSQVQAGLPAVSQADHNEPTKIVYPVMVTISMAGETTAMIGASRPTDWTGGMFSRMLILSANRKPKENREWYDWPVKDLARIRSLVADCETLAKGCEGVTVSEKAWRVFDDWNDPCQNSTDGLPNGQATVLSRLGRHVKIVAALYALSCGTTEVSAEVMRAAVNLGRWSHQTVLGLPIG